jgi:hypothetical protein
MAYLPITLCSILAGCLVSTVSAAGQQIYLPEHDAGSMRKSQLKGSNTSSTEVLRQDLDRDGDPDIIECWWNGKRVRWIDENDNMLPGDRMGDRADDCLQVDRDGDGFYDGPSDMNVDYVDDDGDGRPELQCVAINPSVKQATIHAGDSHWMIFEDVDKDGVFGCINWNTFEFECWGVDPKSPDFKPDYNGNSVFLKEHMPVWALKNPSYSWENPFAFFDFDKDGCTEMAIRLCDNKIKDDTTSSEVGTWSYDGKIDEGYVTWDLDNDSARGNEMDYDMTLRFSGGDLLDYNQYRNKHPKMRAPDWTLPYFRENKWRQLDELVYVPHDKCYDELLKANWGQVWMTFDEDDDDHRWERVELYYPERDGIKADPWSVARYGRGSKTHFGLDSNVQSDSLGDRGEFDMDNSGKAKLYVGRWDHKIHLYGAEWGGWTVDREGKYWGGAGPARGNASPQSAPSVQEVVLYRDTDKNGFIDEITYDYNGDRKTDLKISLLELSGGKSGSDKADLLSPQMEKWQGLHEFFNALADQSWTDAMIVYEAAWEKGLSTAEMDRLVIASSTAEKYNNAYWIQEDIFRALNSKLANDPGAQKELCKLHFLGEGRDLASFIRRYSWKTGE